MSASPIRTARRAVSLAAAGCLAAGLAATFTGCGQTTPVIPEGACQINFVNPSQLQCQIASHNMVIGEVSADQRANLVEDQEKEGDYTVSLTCSVVPVDGGFKISASLAKDNGSYVTLSVPTLNPKASKDSPSEGVVLYQSLNTAKSFSDSKCKFYFLPGQSVVAGEVFFTFECDAISAGADNICTLQPSYAAFRLCETTEEG